MKLSADKCQIVGIRLGELTLNILNPMQPVADLKFVLMREDGSHAGLYSKAGGWSDKTAEAFEAFVDALENQVLGEIFSLSEEGKTQEVVAGSQPATQDIPVLGDPRGVPQI